MEPGDDEDVVDHPPPAFEQTGAFPLRLFASLREGWQPRLTATSFAVGDRIGPAILFAILTFIPFTALQGIIPYTHTLRFGNVFGVERVESTMTVGTDVMHAMGIAMLVLGVELLFFGASYVSLANAFGKAPPGARTTSVRVIALRAVLYRAWLFPMAGTFGLPVMLASWAMPKDAQSSILVFVVLMLGVIPLVLHFMGMRDAARRACGVSDGMSIIVVIVPFILQIVVHGILVGDGMSDGLLADWLPEPAVEAVEP